MIYINLDNYNNRHIETINFYNKTVNICENLQKEHPEIFNTTCGNFALTSASLLQEINRKRSNMLQSIDVEEINKREKRGLINMIGHIQKTLFGTLDDEDGEMYNTQIRELQNSRVGMLKIVDKQTSILKLTNSAFKDAQGMEIQIKSLNITCHNLETSLRRVWYQVDMLEIRTTITNLITTLLLLLQQLVFETDMIGEIISAAQNGIIHSGIITTRELRMQLRDILISLPGQLKLPFDVNSISLYELSKTSKLAIVYMNGTLVFELIIPLLNPVELTLYHIIPLPVRREKLYMHLTPEFEYMAISKTHEYYLTISVTHLMKCRELASITMCPETQPLRIGSTGLPCEIELFMKPTVVPSTCTIKYLELVRSIYHKLKYHNKWIYIINTLDDVAVTCDRWDNAKNIQLRGVGILTLSEQCRAHTPQVVLTPNRHLKSVQYIDFIPPVNIPSVKIPVGPSIKFDNLLNHQNSIIKLNHISDFSKTIEELENAVQDEKDRSLLQTTTGMHTKIIILLCIILGITIVYSLYSTYKNKQKYRSHRIVVPRVEVTTL